MKIVLCYNIKSANIFLQCQQTRLMMTVCIYLVLQFVLFWFPSIIPWFHHLYLIYIHLYSIKKYLSSYMSVHINIYIDTNIDCMTNYMYEKLLYCAHVWMAPGKISCKLTVSPSLNNFWIELKHNSGYNTLNIYTLYIGPRYNGFAV